MPGSPVPRIESELIPWLMNFGPKLEAHAPGLDLSPAEIAATLADIHYITYMVNVRIPWLRQSLSAAVEYKNLLMEGDATAQIPSTLPGSVLPPPYPDPIIPGAMVRLRKLVQNIKSRPGYSRTIGMDLGIISVNESVAPAAPTLALKNAAAGNVTLGWNKSGWTGVKIQSRSGSGDWIDLGVDLFSPFVDTRPLASPNQPERREYRASYLDGDMVLPGASQVIEVTVHP